jgi:hypothetical protein
VRIQAGARDAGAGARTLELDLMNCGSAPYTLTGYPDIQVLDSDRRPLEIVVTHQPPISNDGRTPSLRTIHLTPGHGALVLLEWHNTVTDATPVTGRYLKVTARAGDEPQLVELGRDMDLGTTGTLKVSPWNG